MLICPILSPYFSRPWSWTEYQCHNYHAIVCDHVHGGIRLSGFVLAEFIANKNVYLPILVDHGRIISVTVKRLVTNYTNSL